MSEEERARQRMVRRAALGSRLRQLRTDRRWSQEALARKAGVDRATYSRIETGTAGARVDTLWEIAAALGVPMSDLFREPRRPEHF
jgi:transcriptional regulator with XRE-family HTH domain